MQAALTNKKFKENKNKERKSNFCSILKSINIFTKYIIIPGFKMNEITDNRNLILQIQELNIFKTERAFSEYEI